MPCRGLYLLDGQPRALAAVRRPNMCDSDTPCSLQRSLCNTGASSGTGYSWYCMESLPANALPTGRACCSMPVQRTLRVAWPAVRRPRRQAHTPAAAAPATPPHHLPTRAGAGRAISASRFRTNATTGASVKGTAPAAAPAPASDPHAALSACRCPFLMLAAPLRPGPTPAARALTASSTTTTATRHAHRSPHSSPRLRHCARRSQRLRACLRMQATSVRRGRASRPPHRTGRTGAVRSR